MRSPDLAAVLRVVRRSARGEIGAAQSGPYAELSRLCHAFIMMFVIPLCYVTPTIKMLSANPIE